MIFYILLTILLLSINAQAAVFGDRKKPEEVFEGGCEVPSCAYSDLSLDSALSTFFCIPEQRSSQMEEQEKMSLLITKIAPGLLISHQELKAMNSSELVELVNLVTYGANFFPKSTKKTTQEYLDLAMENSAIALLHKPLDRIMHQEMDIFRDVSPILLLYSICSSDTTRIVRMESNDCTCANFVNPNGYGNCGKADSDFGGAVSCYVNLPTDCIDLKQSETNPELYLSAQACACTCTNFVNVNGYGKCQKADSDFWGALSCYVNKLNNCGDLKQSETNPELYLSSEACK